MITKTKGETWFEFARPHGRQAIYGYGTVKEADRYCLQLNIRRDKNFYSYRPLADFGISLAVALADMAEG